ncbi:ABC transporter ATP-binding protein [Halococcoides cellulosivorans]|uniref:Cobalamin import ATP-binding protein BtuD n=1 Tax=Halococcoides cellulosivorans TaxID=1679096 RepID=A0A2R4WXM1_9EURY|nr:ABC transporter ATP-binding protein [Halococcoides cellulosivorans]AWB26294.1 ABC transporter ATP-binding protein [Halococcoides cellulosivorans]
MTLQIDDLHVGYDERVLDGLSLRVEAGELLGVLGPNGSGKSTLLQCVVGLLDPDAGSITLDGTPIDHLASDERARRVGYVPQSESRAFPATVFETILQGRRPHGGWAPSARDRAAVRETIDRLGLADLATRKIADLSGGQRQKVRLGRALVGDPEVLVLDEPTSALDLQHRLRVIDEIRRQVGDDVAGIVAIHDLTLAARSCDRVALLADGQVHAVGGPEILTPERIEAVYGVEASVLTHRDRRVIVPDAPVPSAAAGDRGATDPGDDPDRPRPTTDHAEPTTQD